jgi:hypothetical protein
MNSKTSAGCAIALVLTACTMVAHHSLSQFDTEKSVTVKGTVVLFERVNPHSFIYIDEKRTDGQKHRWAIEGPGITQLTRLRVEKDSLKIGDVIEACGYTLKNGVTTTRTVNTQPISLSLKDTMPKSMTGQVLTGELLTMPDGTKHVWTDYGHHKCLGEDYRDQHTK